MTHVLPRLPYALDALEPTIDAETLNLHYKKHHRAYVDKLNSALKKYPHYQKLSVEDLLRRLDSLPPAVRDDIRKHGGGHANHSLFWRSMSARRLRPGAFLKSAIQRDFKTADNLRKKFQETAEHVFGAGWVFLNWRHADQRLEIISTADQDSPLSAGPTPLLAFDLWEHAYYLKYRNERAKWIAAWWKLIDWESVEQNLRDAQREGS